MGVADDLADARPLLADRREEAAVSMRSDDPVERALSAAEQDLAAARKGLAEAQQSCVRWQAEVDRCERQVGLLEPHRLAEPEPLFAD